MAKAERKLIQEFEYNLKLSSAEAKCLYDFIAEHFEECGHVVRVVATELGSACQDQLKRYW